MCHWQHIYEYSSLGFKTRWRHQKETFSALLALCAGNHRSPRGHKGQWRGALMFSFICAWINNWENNRETGVLSHHCGHYDVHIMKELFPTQKWQKMFVCPQVNRHDSILPCMSFLSAIVRQDPDHKNDAFDVLLTKKLWVFIPWFQEKYFFQHKNVKKVRLYPSRHHSIRRCMSFLFLNIRPNPDHKNVVSIILGNVVEMF